MTEQTSGNARPERRSQPNRRKIVTPGYAGPDRRKHERRDVD